MGTVEIQEEAPAIKALGSLFKLTEVHLWDDGTTETPQNPVLCKSKKLVGEGDSIYSDINSTSSDLILLPEDEELVKELNALGLPLSFHTNKEDFVCMQKHKKLFPLHVLEPYGYIMSRCKLTNGKVNGRSLKHSHKHREDRQKESSVINAHESQTCISGQEEAESSTHVCFDNTSNGNCPESVVDYELNFGFPMQSAVVSTDNGIIAEGHTSLGNDTSPKSVMLEGRSCSCEETNDTSLTGNESVDILSEDFCSKTGQSISGYTNIEQLSVSEHSPSSELMNCVEADFQIWVGDYGDWTVYWDSYYRRNFFYNMITQLSTWDPPSGLEHLTSDEYSKLDETTAKMCSMHNDAKSDADNLLPEELPVDGSLNGFDPITQNSNLSVPLIDSCNSLAGEEEWTNGRCNKEVTSLNFNPDAQSAASSSSETIATLEGNVLNLEAVALKDEFDSQLAPSKKVKKKKRARTQKKLSQEFHLETMFSGYSISIDKYWCQRYSLFSRFDEGIWMDEEGWFSVTPELIARHHASRCGSGIVIDAFTGVGGNAIQFAQRNAHVIAVDIDPTKIDYARQNAAVYGVEDHIDFIEGDFFELAPNLKADTMFLSPPWGGPDYSKSRTYDMKTMLKPCDGFILFDLVRRVTAKIIMFLPRNVDLNQLAEMALTVNPPWSLEVERNFLNGKLKAVTAYFRDRTAAEG